MALPPPSPEPEARQAAPSLTTRGFTGHEHIDGLGVIHMNGRIYDPDLGRFLQPDPVIQAPNNAQSWNAYTYVFNNPLRYTDPTGMIGIEERQWAGAAVAIVMTAIYPGSAPMWYSMLTGMVAGWVSTGNMQGAITGAISAGLFAGIGSYFETARWANAPSGSGAFGSGLTWGGYGAKTLSHGVAGGVMSSMQGGKFGHGFASAGAAQAFSPMIDNIRNSSSARIAAAAIVGGVASVLSGGKFANGAVTAAFSRAFNDEVHGGKPWSGDDAFDRDDLTFHAFTEANQICESSQGGCSVGAVAGIVLREQSAPNRNLAPRGVAIDPAQSVSAWISPAPGWDLPSTYKAPIGYVTQSIHADGLGVTNTTQRIHGMFPGRIIRRVVESGSGVWVVTHGVGVNRALGPAGMAGNYGLGKGNDLFGPKAFRDMDSQVRRSWERSYGGE